MKNKFICALMMFSIGYIANDIIGDLVKPAHAYGCECEADDLDLSSYDISDFQYAVESIVEEKISKYNYDFKRNVQSIIEDCSTKNGDISC